MRAVLLLGFFLMTLCGCQASDSDLATSIQLGFSYCRFDSAAVTLGLRMENRSNSTLYAWNDLRFLVNDQRHEPPFIPTEEWKQKPFLPHAPKWRLEEMTNEQLVSFLGPGEWTMKWQFGPVSSNSIVIAITEDGQIQELAVECEPFAEEVARTRADQKLR